jgi:hypothetical protein
MVSHELGLVFIHIPKCAGTSFEAAFGHLNLYTGPGAQDHRTIRMLQQPWVGFDALRSIENIHELGRRFAHNYYHPMANPRNRLTLTKEQYQKYIKASVIRNPWSRAVSWYHNVIESEYHLNRLKIKSGISFKEFLFRFAGFGPLRSQIDWLEDFSGVVKFDYLVRFENISDLSADLSKSLGVKIVQLPHLIRSRGCDYREKYDAESNDYVARIFSREISMFKFEFDDERRVKL